MGDVLAIGFEVDSGRYALPAARVVEVVPFVALRPVPGTAPGVVGLLRFRASLVPVVDLGVLWAGRASPARLSTRIVVCRLDGEGERRVGLVAERATQVLRVDPAAVDAGAGPATPGARGLGRLMRTEDGVVQWVEVEDLLPPDVVDALQRSSSEDAA